MAGLKSRNVKKFDQAGALPFRRTRRGLEFCLITSTEGRWIFPKGVVDPDETYKETATKEAFEEAGLRGRLVGSPLGCCEMVKCGKRYTLVLLLMEVTACEEVWEEAHSANAAGQRRTRHDDCCVSHNYATGWTRPLHG